MKVQFVLNVPMQLALQDPSGQYDATYEEVSYPTVDGRELVLPVRAAERLNLLDLRPQESFGLCKRWTKEKGSIPYFDIWLSPASEQARAAAEIAQAERQPAATLTAPAPASQPLTPQPRKRQRRAKVEAMPTPGPLAIPAEPQRATGTYGPTPQLAPPMPARFHAMSRPQRVPFNVAFREVVGFVSAELKASGEQWSDQARQDLVSTVLISASRQGLLDLWERPA